MRPLVYIAGASREWQRAQRMADALHDRTGCIYEVPWWRTAPQWTGQDARLSIDAQRGIAVEDMRGIMRADLIWVLWPETDGRSAVETELGIALVSADRRTVVSGRRASESIFTSMVTLRESSDEVALVEIVRHLGAR